MKLYEINGEILRLTDQITFDEETGEILCDIDAIYDEIGKLQMERKSILEYLAKLVLNLRAEAVSLKAEEQRLKARRDRLGKKEERLMKILDRECAGEKTDLGVATFSYRKTSHVDVSDAAKAIRWLKRHQHTDCYRISDPEINKNDVKKLMKAGAKIPGLELVQDQSYSMLPCSECQEIQGSRRAGKRSAISETVRQRKRTVLSGYQCGTG